MSTNLIFVDGTIKNKISVLIREKFFKQLDPNEFNSIINYLCGILDHIFNVFHITDQNKKTFEDKLFENDNQDLFGIFLMLLPYIDLKEQQVKESMSNHNDDIIPINEYKYSSFEEDEQPHIPQQETPSYYKMPNFSEVNNSSSSSKEPLMEKINYMIHLLEEQQDEKTGNVTEEVILYSFLGIFIIFIVDSFYYVGKYTR